MTAFGAALGAEAPVPGPRPGAPGHPSGPFAPFRAFRRDPLVALVHAHRAEPDVARIPLGPLAVYSVAHPDGVRRVLADNHANYIKGRTYEWLRRSVGRGLLTTDRDDHRWRRSLLMPAFSRNAVRHFLPVVNQCVEATAREWIEGADEPRDLHDDMVRLTLRVIGRLLFAEDFAGADNALRASLNDGSKLVRRLLSSPSQFLPAFLPTPVNRALSRNRLVLHGALYERVRRRGEVSDEGQDLLSALLQHVGPRERLYSDHRELFEELVLLVGAGHETTANTLAWTWYFLATRPAVQRRVAAECAALDGRAPGVDDLPRLEYTTRTIMESMRLMPPAWGILRQTLEPDEVCGVPVPAGAFVVVSPYVVQRDPRWWPDPLRFDPDRHLADDDRPRYSYLPFGAGPRACIGRLLAENESVAALAALVPRFTVALADAGGVRSQTLVTLQPKGGLPATVSLRRRTAADNAGHADESGPRRGAASPPQPST
jgi:cytochrome P450